MKKPFLLFFTILLLACQSSTSGEKAEAPVPPVPMKVSQAVAQSDSIPPRRNNYIVETSRQLKDMKQDFPFDIPMTNGVGEVVNSAEVLNAGGKPTVVLFWLTTCYPCRMEMAAIQKKYDSWKQELDFNLVAVSTDFPQNYPNFLKRVEESKWPFGAYHDTNREFWKVLPGGLNGLPQTFVFDPKGEIVYHSRKYSTGDEDKLFAKLKEISSL